MDEENKFLPRRLFQLRKLELQLRTNAHKPFIGVTQGGSSRKWAGCRPAATDGTFRPEPVKETE